MNETISKELHQRMHKITMLLTETVDDIKREGLQHNQEVLNWIDNINRLSVEI